MFVKTNDSLVPWRKAQITAFHQTWMNELNTWVHEREPSISVQQMQATYNEKIPTTVNWDPFKYCNSDHRVPEGRRDQRRQHFLKSLLNKTVLLMQGHKTLRQLVAQQCQFVKHTKGFTWYFFLGVGCNGAFIKPPNTTPSVSPATWIWAMPNFNCKVSRSY